MSMGSGMTEWASELGAYIDDLDAIMSALLLDVAKAAVVEIQREWPVATGFSRDRWSAEATAGGAVIVCTADYSSFVFKGQDDSRNPVYPSIVARAIQNAIDSTQVAARFADVTDAYIGQGRKTAGLTGVSRKFAIHTPTDQADAWRKNYPELVERITVQWRGEVRELETVPSDTVAGGQMGSGTVRPRRVG